MSNVILLTDDIIYILYINMPGHLWLLFLIVFIAYPHNHSIVFIPFITKSTIYYKIMFYITYRDIRYYRRCPLLHITSFIT